MPVIVVVGGVADSEGGAVSAGSCSLVVQAKILVAHTTKNRNLSKCVIVNFGFEMEKISVWLKFNDNSCDAVSIGFDNHKSISKGLAE